MKRRYGVNLIEHLQHDGIGSRLSVERDRQARPNYKRYVVDRIVAHERVVAGHFAAVKVHAVRPKCDLGYPIPIFLTGRFARILGL